MAAQGLGIAQGATDYALEYARTRETMGKPIAEHQLIAAKLADMETRCEAARGLLYRFGRMVDEGADDAELTKASPMAKVYCTDTAMEVATEAMHVSSHRPTDRPDYGDDAVEDLREDDAAVGTDSDPTGPAASYPPTYYGPAALFYLAAPDDTVAQVHAVRLWSALLGALAIVFAWLFAGEVLPGRRWARAGLVTAIALQPINAQNTPSNEPVLP